MEGGVFLGGNESGSHGANYFKFVWHNDLSSDNLFSIHSFHLVSPQTRRNPEVLIRLDARVEITEPNHKTLLPHGRPEAHEPRQVISDENSGSNCGPLRVESAGKWRYLPP